MIKEEPLPGSFVVPCSAEMGEEEEKFWLEIRMDLEFLFSQKKKKNIGGRKVLFL